MPIELDLGPQARAFRDEVRAWLEANRPGELVGVDAQQAALAETGPLRAWADTLHEAGYMCVSWPEEYGGRGLTGVEVAVLNEEFARAGVPRLTRGMGEWLVGPSIIVWGTDAQKAHFLPRIIDGTDRYCQGFSEPDAGSDLASLKTRGLVDGEQLVITGQKVWTSGAQLANMMFCLCRTDADAPKHQGISYVLVPMRREDGSSNGFEMRPIRQMTGQSGFTETFITEARAPLFNVIGGLHQGWRVTMTTLGNERGGNATTQHVRYRRQWDAAVEEVRHRGRAGDPLVRQHLASAYTHCEIMRYQGLRILSEVVARKEPGPASALNKMFWSEYARRFAEIVVDIRGAHSLVMPDQPPGDYRPDRWQREFLSTRSVTIWGGTAEVQRNIVGERVLGLPKEPKPPGADRPAGNAGRDAGEHAATSADTSGPTDAQKAEKAERREQARRGMLLAWWAARQPDVPAVTAPSGDRTFGEINARANQLVRALRRLGLRPGDAVALLCGNRPEFVEVAAACQRAGWRLTPVNWHLTADEAGYIVDDCEAVALVADRERGQVATGAARRASRCRVLLAVGGPIDGFRSYEDELAGEPGHDIDDATLGTTMLYTSGTTGRPKGVHRRETPASAVTAVNLFGYRPGDRHLCTGPLYHAAPLAFSLTIPLTYGVGVVLMERWDAEAALALVQAHRITHTHMVPTMFHRLLSLPEEVRASYDVSSLRSVLHGAAPCPVPVKRRLIEWLGPIVWEYYAATEGTGSFVDAETWLARPGTVGKPAEGQVMIGDETGAPLPPGTVGLVYLKAPEVGRFEYFKDEGKTASTYRGDHFTLGDLGYIDEDGYLFLTDRSANLVISGGVNIYPAEIDAVLLDHPAVGDAATIGVPDDEWGERVVAVVEPQPEVAPGPELAAELIEHCRARLAHYKCPQAVEFVDELPRQDNGKIYKRLLRDRYRAGRR